MSIDSTDRRHDLDALRVFACYLLFLFHVGMVFNPAPFFHVRNDESNMVFLIVCGFIGLWHMPLLFLLAGWSAAASLRSRGVGTFLRERVSKLAVPLLAGCVLLMPVIKYLELRSGQNLNHEGLFVTAQVQESIRSVIPIDLPLMEPLEESFLSFLPTFFTDLDRFSWSHLWFVAYLLTFTLVLLPVFARLARREPRREPNWTPTSRAWVYFPLLPLTLIQLTLRVHFPGPYNLYNDWANVAFFVTFLCSGFAMALAPGLEDRLREEWRRALALGLTSTGVLLAAVLGAFESTPVVLTGSAVAGWCFVVALLGFARERVTRSGPGLRYLAESAFPIYVLHQPVVVVLAAVVVTLPASTMGIAAKFVLLLTGSVACTLALYHFGVRPFAPTRFLLGMKPLSREPGGAAVASATPATAHSRAWHRASLLALLALPLWAGTAEAGDPTGLWWAERGSAKVEIARCGDALCGRVAWLRHPFDEHGCDLRDAENPDPALRGRPVVGLSLLRNLRASPDDPGEWNGGDIYDPTSGRTYDAVLQMDGPDQLRVRGYFHIRLLGRTTTWFRVGSENQCREET
ncbi:MAG: DUF2147 domain-containing protein [Deltaproteobacteria bacterium]|nr:DUF2147 domain-containing protein [Deltaproteobacteria bacterium]MBW2415782.1 DUF2147 domain-containing protein [Deltaproteobacteria bacterium]